MPWYVWAKGIFTLVFTIVVGIPLFLGAVALLASYRNGW